MLTTHDGKIALLDKEFSIRILSPAYLTMLSQKKVALSTLGNYNNKQADLVNF